MEFALTEKYRRYASRRRIKSVLWLVCGSILMSAGFVLFMNPYQVVPGGVYGLGIVLHALFPSIQVGTFGLMFDIPLLLIGLKVFGRMFGAKTVTAALLIPVLMNTMTYFIGENPATMFGGKMDLSNDLFLVCIFGGVLIGAGLGMIIKTEATSGGTDIVAMLLVIAMIAGAFFGNSGWVATSCYFVGIAAIICSGIILKKTKMFAGDPAPFVMELPAYHWPTVSNILRSMWERGWSFIKKAGTIILLSTIILWFLMSFGWEGGSFGMVEELNESILSKIGTAIAWIFAPLGWTKAGEGWKMAVAAVTGLIAKENVVATFGMLYGFAEVAEDGAEIWGNLAAAMTPIAAYGFLVFNLLCAPCFAAMGAIKREMNNTKWFLFAIGYQCGLAYLVSLCIYQIGTLVTGGGFGIWTVVAFAIIIGFLYLLFRPYKESGSLNVKVKGMAKAR